MLVRVRTNLGTWKVPQLDNETSTIQNVIQYLQDHYYSNNNHSNSIITPKKKKLQFSQVLSLDVNGNVPIDTTKTLKEQNITHGTMIYCRIDIQDNNNKEDDDDTNNKEKEKVDSNDDDGKKKKVEEDTTQQNKQVKKKNMTPTIVDLLSSDDDDDDDDDDNRSVDLLASSSNDEDEEEEDEQPINVKHRHTTTSSHPSNSNNKVSSSTSATSPICLLDDSDDDMKGSSVGEGRGNTGNKRKTDSPTTTTSNKKAKSATSTATTTTTNTNTSITGNNQTTPPSFQIASYNIWFGPPDPLAKGVHVKQRMAAIVEEIRNCHQRSHNNNNPLWCIGFQEVTNELQCILAPKLIDLGYVWYPQLGISSSNNNFYGCALAIHKSITVLKTQFIPYSNTVQHRGILVAHTKSLLFATTHLESFISPTQTNSIERHIQAKEMSKYCYQQLLTSSSLKLAIFVGDLNWDDEVAPGTRSTKRTPDNMKLIPLLNSAIQTKTITIEEEDDDDNNHNNSSSSEEEGGWIDAWLEFSTKSPKAAVAASPSSTSSSTTTMTTSTTTTTTGQGKPKKTTTASAAAATAAALMGYTYDSKENPMLLGNLRRRFDRCLILPAATTSSTSTKTAKATTAATMTQHQQSFIQQVDFLGTKAIPNLTWNKRNLYNGSTRIVPVAPSDHFGIAVTIPTSILTSQQTTTTN